MLLENWRIKVHLLESLVEYKDQCWTIWKQCRFWPRLGWRREMYVLKKEVRGWYKLLDECRFWEYFYQCYVQGELKFCSLASYLELYRILKLKFFYSKYQVKNEQKLSFPTGKIKQS